MKDELTLKDFWLFFKDNKKIIFLIALLFSLIGIGLVGMDYFASESEEDPATEETFTDLSPEEFAELEDLPFEMISDDDIALIQDYQDHTAYSFMIYVMNESGEPVGNLSMMRALFRHEDVVNQAAQIIGEEITPDPVLAVNIESFGDEGLFELQFGRIDRESSEELAGAYYQILEEGGIFALNDLNVSIYEEAPIPVRPIIDEDDEREDAPSVTHSPRAFIRNAVIVGGGTFVIGIFMGVFISLAKLLISKKVSSLYDYVREDSDKVVRLSHLRHVTSDKKIEKAIKNIAFPKANRKLVLHEQEFDKELLSTLQKGIHESVGNLDQILFEIDFSDVNEEFDEVIILTKTNETTKDWYNNQRVQLRGYRYPTKIIQF